MMDISPVEISILSEEVINQIAAGEVVERPAHLVKELIENSIDAGSKKIEISIWDGGRTVFITDDGVGIPKNQMSLALKRFATSKISKIEDIFKLNSFGFRGEALASIASVSHLQLISKSKDQKEAHSILSEFGQVHEPILHPGTQGTSIRLSKLFENIPARLKFLKTPGAENSAIRNVIRALALANFEIEFTFKIEGVLDLQFKAESELARTQKAMSVQNLYFSEGHNIFGKSRIYFSAPNEVQKTQKNIWIFAQNRWIQDRTIQAQF